MTIYLAVYDGEIFEILEAFLGEDAAEAYLADPPLEIFNDVPGMAEVQIAGHPGIHEFGYTLENAIDALLEVLQQNGRVIEMTIREDYD